MKEAFKAAKVTDKVYWVGAVDWAVRDFHGYLTNRGTTYNAYLILADKIALVDAVKASFKDEMLARIASIVDPKKIEIVISNHAEPDHTGALGGVIEAIKPQKVLASMMGVKALDQHYHGACPAVAVRDGEKLSLGNVDLTFAETRMCHWPDSMVCYLHQERMLISQDAFGMHLASYERFDDQLSPALLDAEAAKYYANILLPLSSFVAKTIEKVAATGWTLDTIAPDHGPIWRKDPQRIVASYARWSRQPRINKAVVLYDTMWQSTDLMARAIGEGLAAGGTATRLMPLSGTHRSDIATEVLDAGALIVGAPTVNNEIFPTLADAMTYLRGLAPKGLIGASFGSYGWSGEAPKDLRAMLEEMKVELVGEPVRVVYAPAGEDLKRCYDLGLQVAARLKEKYPPPASSAV
ncbi:MAG: flavodoxin domain-containing protein [Planctomycetota bacterium]|nr:flavodoxin domain-containing protein [Planctomycetota bacterium]